MWVEMIRELSARSEFSAPASPTDLDDAGRLLDWEIPGELRSLLLESNGVTGRTGERIVWSIDLIVSENLEFRSFPTFAELYAPFDGLLFFGDNGGGDQFAYPIQEEGIFVWEHELDERFRVAGDLEDYVRRVLTAENDGWYLPEYFH